MNSTELHSPARARAQGAALSRPPVASSAMLASGAFSPSYTLRCFEENLRPLAEDYFRASLVDEHHVPLEHLGERAIIVVPNHSGMGLSWDNIILDFLLYDLLRRRGWSEEGAVRSKALRLVDPLLVHRTFVRPFGIEDWWTRIGCKAASFAAFEDAVREKRLVLLSPEGTPGIRKGWHRRYQLQRFSSSFLALAKKHGAVVVPVSVVNAEYLRPFAYCVAWVDRLVQRMGMPFLPLGLGMLELLFPATYMNVFPAKLTYVVHEPIVYEAEGRAPSREALRDEVEAFRAAAQARLSAAVAQHHGPYRLRELAARFSKSRNKRAMLPFLWHELFLRTAGLPAILAFLYKIPLGYPLVWIARALVRSSRRALRAAPETNAEEGAVSHGA